MPAEPALSDINCGSFRTDRTLRVGVCSDLALFGLLWTSR